MSDAQWKLNSSLHSLVVSGIDCILKHEYDQADSIFNIVIKIYPDHPAGHLYRAAAGNGRRPPSPGKPARVSPPPWDIGAGSPLENIASRTG